MRRYIRPMAYAALALIAGMAGIWGTIYAAAAADDPPPTVSSITRTCSGLTVNFANLRRTPPEGWSASIYVDGALFYTVVNRYGDYSITTGLSTKAAITVRVEMFEGEPHTQSLPEVRGCSTRHEVHRDCVGLFWTIFDARPGAKIQVFRDGVLKTTVTAPDEDPMHFEFTEDKLPHNYRLVIDGQQYSNWDSPRVWACVATLTRDCTGISMTFPDIPQGEVSDVRVLRDAAPFKDLIVNGADTFRVPDVSTEVHRYEIFLAGSMVFSERVARPETCDPPTSEPPTSEPPTSEPPTSQPPSSSGSPSASSTPSSPGPTPTVTRTPTSPAPQPTPGGGGDSPLPTSGTDLTLLATLGIGLLVFGLLTVVAVRLADRRRS